LLFRVLLGRLVNGEEALSTKGLRSYFDFADRHSEKRFSDIEAPPTKSLRSYFNLGDKQTSERGF
jgi:hypothetical protein